MGRISRDRRDVYYRKAKEVGFRARSAFKLLQLDDAFHFLSPPTSSCSCSLLRRSLDGLTSSTENGDTCDSSLYTSRETEWEFAEEFGATPSEQAEGCSGMCGYEVDLCSSSSVADYPHRAVDLCAAPGSWSQVLRRRLWENYERKLQDFKQASPSCAARGHKEDGARQGNEFRPSQLPPAPPLIVAVDLQELAPLPGVCMLQGDITHASTAQAILRLFNDMPADIVVCDGAPDVTGTRDVDEFIQMQLVMAALATAAQVLRPGGTFVCKVFRGEQVALMYVQLMALFADVRCCKPAASRSSSVEAFVVCRGFHPRATLGISLGNGESSAREQEAESGEVKMGDKAEGSCPGGRTFFGEATDNRPETHELQAELLGSLAPFLSCGSVGAFDSDRNYFLAKASHRSRPPTQPPTHPAYELALRRKRGEAATEEGEAPQPCGAAALSKRSDGEFESLASE